MSEDKTGGPAFPLGKGCGWNESGGLSIRDYFAAAALTGIITKCSDDTRESGEYMAQMFAKKAYDLADWMLKQRDGSV